MSCAKIKNLRYPKKIYYRVGPVQMKFVKTSPFGFRHENNQRSHHSLNVKS